MKHLFYCFLFMVMNIFSGSSESDDELPFPLGAAQDYPPVQHRVFRERPQVQSQSPTHDSLNTHASDHDIEALTIQERISKHRLKIAVAGLAATTIASTVSLTLYFHDCQK